MTDTITTNYLIIETALAAYAVFEEHMLLARTRLPDSHPFKAADEAMAEWWAAEHSSR
jgi:hypothetical protein